MILIKKNKLLYCEVNLTPIVKEMAIDLTHKEGLTKCTNEMLILDKKVTFHDLFQHILREEKTLNIQYMSHIKGNRISDYVEDFNNDAYENYKKGESLKYLQLGWNTEISEKTNLTLNPVFNGITDSKKEGDIERGLELTSLCEYKHLPILLNNSFEIYCYNKKNHKKEILFNSTRTFVLYDLLSAIFSCISQFGLPKARNRIVKKLDKTIADIDSGKTKLLSENDFRKRLEKMKKKINKK